jgi:hypothetical protein
MNEMSVRLKLTVVSMIMFVYSIILKKQSSKELTAQGLEIIRKKLDNYHNKLWQNVGRLSDLSKALHQHSEEG